MEKKNISESVLLPIVNIKIQSLNFFSNTTKLVVIHFEGMEIKK